MLTHIARGTDLQGDVETFLTEQQGKLDRSVNPAITQVPRAWRLQPVKRGRLGLTDIRVVQKAARQALLIDAGQEEPDQGIKEIAEANTKRMRRSNGRRSSPRSSRTSSSKSTKQR